MSYAVHQDMRGQTGGAISMGHGLVNQKSLKQKLNSKSSTVTELIGLSDMVPHIILIKIFLDIQGYVVKENVLYQDNQSKINMERNGRMKSTGYSRYIVYVIFL